MKAIESQILKILAGEGRPINRGEILRQLGDYKSGRRSFGEAITKLTKSKEVVYIKGKFSLPRHKRLVEAEIVKVTDSYGFAAPTADINSADYFVHGKSLAGTMPGDIVQLRPIVGRGGELSEGEVVSVEKEVNTPFIGIVTKERDGKFYVLPDNYVKFLLLVDGKQPSDKEIGFKVLAQISYRGASHFKHKVKIINSFGSSEKASICAEAILASNGILRRFSSETMDQARAIASGTGIHPKELAMRDDLRGENIFTIDGADTKDIDDAISLKPTQTGWELGVHIADVSYYVTRQSPLDIDAYNRGTSVYFANQVIPMLPPELSNGICSLNPNEDRLAFSAVVNLSKEGVIEDYSFHKTVINSKLQGVYSEINALFEDSPPEELKSKYADQLEVLTNMKKLAETLNARRIQRGAINLESTESNILIDGEGKITDIIPRVSGFSQNMIEEFMLIANEAAASFALERGLPFVYRVHEPPKSEKLENLFLMLDRLGISYDRPKKEESPASVMDDVLAKVADTPLAQTVNYSILRSMTKAKYSENNLGHFGLALKKYTHFTSPIRRYPDLAIHRILSGLLTGMRRENIEKYFRDWVAEVGEQSTQKEMTAMTAERQAEDCYKAEYMKDFIGSEFEGTISSATGFGIFVALPNTVEGLVRMDDFPQGRWVYDGLLSHQNDVGGATLTVGDTITVTLINVNIAKGDIDFAITKPELYAGKVTKYKE